MGRLLIKKQSISSEKAAELIKLCPFGAISYDNGTLDISSACKMCKLCAKKSDGIIEYSEEEERQTDKSRWRGVCVFAEHTSGNIHRVTYELLGKARELASVTGHEVYVLMLGADISESAEQLLYYGADKVFIYDEEELRDFRIEPYAAAFYDFIERVKPSSILVGATALGRQLAPRVAARCRTGLTADCTKLEMRENTDLVQIRPAFGGNIMAEIISPNTRPQFCTVRYKVFSEIQKSRQPSGETVKLTIEKSKLASEIKILSVQEKPSDIDISEADVIVALGRGAMSDTMRAYADELAELLGGMVASTRPLVEAGIYDSKHQIGLSGRTVKPKLIICIGISGSVQFAAGMKSSDCIIAVNSDKNAPIFDIAHYAVRGDAAQIIPKLIDRIKEAKGNV